MEALLEYARLRSERADALISEITGDKVIACGRGCAYCCYGVTLWLRKIEVLFLAYALNRKRPKERASYATRLRKYRDIYEKESERVGYRPRSPVREEDLNTEKLGVIGGLGMNDIPCPFLSEEKTCEVYNERPLMCRLTLFRDREVCRRDWENPLAFLWRNEIYPFIEEIKARFLPAFRRETGMIREKLGVPESWETDMVFITDWLRFDPVKKVFYIKENGKKLVP